jgi:hypothetical protein
MEDLPNLVLKNQVVYLKLSTMLLLKESTKVKKKC